MAWFKVDDRLPDHRKVRQLGRDKTAAMGVWLLCGAWSAANLTDGFVPEEIVRRHDPREKMALRLVEVGLWERDKHDGEAGYRFHDWADIQPTREDVEARRADTRSRVARHRAGKAAGQGSMEPPPDDGGNGGGNALHEASNGVGNALQPEDVTTSRAPARAFPARPGPARPGPAITAAATDVTPDRAREPRGRGEHPPPAELDATAHSARGYVLVAAWAERNPGVRTAARRELGRAVDQLLAQGADPTHIPAALDAAHGPRWRNPVKALPHAYDDARRAAHPPAAPPAQHRSTTDERVAAAVALARKYAAEDGDPPPTLLALPGGAA